MVHAHTGGLLAGGLTSADYLQIFRLDAEITKADLARNPLAGKCGTTKCPKHARRNRRDRVAFVCSRSFERQNA